MHKFHFQLSFWSDDNQTEYRCEDSFDAFSPEMFANAMRYFECAYRRQRDECAAQEKVRRAQQHRERNATAGNNNRSA